MASLAGVVRKFTNQTLVWWPRVTSDGFSKPVYQDCQQLPCRWEDKLTEVLMPDGRKVLSRGYLLMSTEFNPGDFVFLGTLAQVQALPTWPSPPTVGLGGREVIRSEALVDISGNVVGYEVWL